MPSSAPFVLSCRCPLPLSFRAATVATGHTAESSSHEKRRPESLRCCRATRYNICLSEFARCALIKTRLLLYVNQIIYGHFNYYLLCVFNYENKLIILAKRDKTRRHVIHLTQGFCSRDRGDERILCI